MLTEGVSVVAGVVCLVPLDPCDVQPLLASPDNETHDSEASCDWFGHKLVYQRLKDRPVLSWIEVGVGVQLGQEIDVVTLQGCCNSLFLKRGHHNSS